MSLRMLSALSGVPLTTIRRICATLRIYPKRVGGACSLTEREQAAILEYVVSRQEVQKRR
jgi:hypothetical protein